MSWVVLIPALAALSLTAAPPQEADSEGPLLRHSDRDACPQAVLDTSAADGETCGNDARSSALVAPVVHQGGLYGYAFVTPRLCLARGVNAFSVTNDMHFIVDRMVRAAHRTPMTLNEDWSVNKDATNAAMLAAAREVIGDSRVERLYLCGEDVRPLR